MPEHKHSPRSDEFKHNLQSRLNRIIGQLSAVKGMIEEDTYCTDLLMQLSAADKALQSIERLILQDHLQTCVVEKCRREIPRSCKKWWTSFVALC